MTAPYSEVLAFLRLAYPSALIDLRESQTGAAMIDVRIGNRFVVIEYLPRAGFGVSELSRSDDSAFGGHDLEFTTPSDVIEHLKRLLGLQGAM